MDVEQRARVLLAAEYKARGELVHAMNIEKGGLSVMYAAEIAAIIAALTPPEGYVLIPVIPAYQMVKALAETAGCNLAHAALAYRDALAARPEVTP